MVFGTKDRLTVRESTTLQTSTRLVCEAMARAFGRASSGACHGGIQANGDDDAEPLLLLLLLTPMHGQAHLGCQKQPGAGSGGSVQTLLWTGLRGGSGRPGGQSAAKCEPPPPPTLIPPSSTHTS